MTAPRFLDAGECALVVEFGSTIDEGTNARVLALDAALTAAPPPGLLELVPTYRSLMVQYDPLTLPRTTLIAAVTQALNTPTPPRTATTLWHIPACYDAAFAEDLPHIAAATGLSPAQVIETHATARYRLTMYGFAPGWAYLGGLPPALALPRRATPRDRIAAGSLIIAGGQAIIAGPAMPSGWHILGRTPERMFAPDRNTAFLMRVGDLVTFAPIDRATFDTLAATGEPVSRPEALE